MSNYNRPSDMEWKIAEMASRDIKDKSQEYYLENVSGSLGYDRVEVLVPMTENINMIFRIDVPHRMMDEDNTVLLKYFRENIYPFIDLDKEEYYAESINRYRNDIK